MRQAPADRSLAYDVPLRGAQLKEAILAGAQLAGADVRGVQGANLYGAHLEGTYLNGADLTKAEGLTSARLQAAKNMGHAKLPAYVVAERAKEAGPRIRTVSEHPRLDAPSGEQPSPGR